MSLQNQSISRTHFLVWNWVKQKIDVFKKFFIDTENCSPRLSHWFILTPAVFQSVYCTPPVTKHFHFYQPDKQNLVSCVCFDFFHLGWGLPLFMCFMSIGACFSVNSKFISLACLFQQICEAVFKLTISALCFSMCDINSQWGWDGWVFVEGECTLSSDVWNSLGRRLPARAPLPSPF